MFESTSGRVQVAEQSARALLASAREAQARARQAEADLLACALQWAIVHPSSDGTADADDAAVFVDPAGVERIAGVGCPGVAEFAIAEFGTELGLTTIAAKRLIGHALELAHRLPRTWRRVLDGEVDPWRARRVAEATIHADPALPVEVAEWVDGQAAPFVNAMGPAKVDRLVEAAIVRFQLERADVDVVESLHATVSAAGTTIAGTIDFSATLTSVDALDLDNALRAAAEELKALGSTEPLSARRARALGQMARRQTSLALGDLDSRGAAGVRGDLPSVARRLDLHLHFAAGTAGVNGVDPVGFMENGRRLVLFDQVKQWLRDSHTELRVLPVLDLAEEIECEGYVPSPRLRRQVQLRDATCVFPWCARPARACDVDHVVPYDASRRTEDTAGPTQTRSSNLATLCRSHHRLKTHTGWRYEVLGPGEYLWVSPHGHRYRRDRRGAARLEPPGFPPHVLPDSAP